MMERHGRHRRPARHHLLGGRHHGVRERRPGSMKTTPTDTDHDILLVDDHPLVRDGLRARLEAVPHFRVVAEAGGADEALAQAAQLRRSTWC